MMIPAFAAGLLAAIVNLTYSPDSSRVAFTRDGDLYVADCAAGDTVRVTSDGGNGILNGYASWVYYEEIFGRPSKYKAFWWSPDSKKLAFWRFDESAVGVFPIFSQDGQYGSFLSTRYPKAGTPNPSVTVCAADASKGWAVREYMSTDASWEYFGTPFWGDDSRHLFVQRMPRRQNRLELVRLDVESSARTVIYRETYPTWITWIEGMLFDREGLYMARDFETGWEQIYYLSYDGTILRRLTDGQNWDVRLLSTGPGKGELTFVAKRDSRLHPSVYRLHCGRRPRVEAVTDPSLYASDVSVGPGGELSYSLSSSRVAPGGEAVNAAEEPYPQEITIENEGFTLYGLITYPRGFDPQRKYPVVMEVYGGPGTAYVRDRYRDRDASNRWCWENGVIWMVVDPRSSGENGRRGMDEAFRRMTVIELQDYIAWARHMQSLPYVRADRIGVDGFSFGGTTASMLVLRYPEYFHCGIAGGGVYDWSLYDSHYTERFMCTPEENPQGYETASVLSYVRSGRVSGAYQPFHLKLTHGLADDNVHMQSTMQLALALQEAGVLFDMMVYPNGKHGYRGAQKEFAAGSDADFWKLRLLD